jgi:beta-phosphoglucomutase-like phosphatase (HAD superfamily)
MSSAPSSAGRRRAIPEGRAHSPRPGRGMEKVSVVFFDLGSTLVRVGGHWVSGARNLLLDMRARSLRLGLISNTSGLNLTRLRPALPRDFDPSWFAPELVILSGEIGIEKPDPAIFEIAVDRAGSSPEACLFCSEDPLDVLVAQRLGMRAARVLPSSGDEIWKLTGWLAAAGLLPAAPDP